MIDKVKVIDIYRTSKNKCGH